MAVYYPRCRAILSIVFDGFGGSDSSPQIIEVIPKDCRVSLNNYKEADTFDMEFDGKLLPISPEQLRSAAVQIYFYGLDNLNASEMESTAPDRVTLAGLIDSAELNASKTGVTFQVSGRDYTAILIDKEWDPTRRVPVGRPLDEVVQGLVDEATQKDKIGRTLNVVFKGGIESPPTFGTIHNVKTKKRGFTPAQGGKNYWDVIYNLCMRHGFIVFVQGFDVVISRPNVLIEEARKSIAKVVYGRNLESLNIERKLGKERVPQIVVRSYDSKTRSVIEGRFPESKDKVLTGIGTEKEEVKSYSVPGITNAKILKRIAENAYNTLARGEATGRFATKHLTDLDDEFDLLTLRAGSAVAIGFDPFVPEAILAAMTEGERYSHLVSLGYTDKMAGLIASGFDKINYFRRPFYVREVSLSWSSRDGITIECEVANFIAEARDEKRSDE